MTFPSLNMVLGQADREGLGDLSASNPEIRVRISDLDLSTTSPNKLLTFLFDLSCLSTSTKSVVSKFDHALEPLGSLLSTLKILGFLPSIRETSYLQVLPGQKESNISRGHNEPKPCQDASLE